MNEQYILKEKNFISIVAYCRNNESDIQSFILKLDKLLKEKFEAYEFIIIDDASIDKTKEKIKEISREINGNIVVIDLAYTHGIEIAMHAGIDFAIGDFIFEFDTPIIDYKLEEILNVYYKSLEGFDIVAASPNVKLKKSSQLFYKYLNKISDKRMELTTETFRIVSRRALNRIFKNQEKSRYRKALYHYSGFSTIIYKYNVIDGKKNYSNISFKEKLELAVNILVNFSDIGIRIAMNISLFFLLITMITILYTIVSYFSVKNIQAGWTTMMLFTSLSFSGIFFVLAILAKYMTVTMNEIKERPVYIFKSVDRLSRR